MLIALQKLKNNLLFAILIATLASIMIVLKGEIINAFNGLELFF